MRAVYLVPIQSLYGPPQSPQCTCVRAPFPRKAFSTSTRWWDATRAHGVPPRKRVPFTSYVHLLSNNCCPGLACPFWPLVAFSDVFLVSFPSAVPMASSCAGSYPSSFCFLLSLVIFGLSCLLLVIWWWWWRRRRLCRGTV